jgi:hypothetical protein
MFCVVPGTSAISGFARIETAVLSPSSSSRILHSCLNKSSFSFVSVRFLIASPTTTMTSAASAKPLISCLPIANGRPAAPSLHACPKFICQSLRRVNRRALASSVLQRAYCELSAAGSPSYYAAFLFAARNAAQRARVAAAIFFLPAAEILRLGAEPVVFATAAIGCDFSRILAHLAF